MDNLLRNKMDRLYARSGCLGLHALSILTWADVVKGWAACQIRQPKKLANKLGHSTYTVGLVVPDVVCLVSSRADLLAARKAGSLSLAVVESFNGGAIRESHKNRPHQFCAFHVFVVDDVAVHTTSIVTWA